MRHILIIGAGLSGCTAAKKFADIGAHVTLVEKAPKIGGKVRQYGCKAVDGVCNNCGVCLTSGLWDKVERNQNIRVFTGAEVMDITGMAGDFTAAVSDGEYTRYIENIEAIIVSTGFESQTSGLSAYMHIESAAGIVTGLELENILLGRTGSKFFESAPKSVAFVQCFGSRDEKEGGLYCSKVCCSYPTRAAQVLRFYYPECEIVFFYMELQNVESGNYYEKLTGMGMEFIKSRPLRIMGGNPCKIEYDDPAAGITSREFEIVFLSEGIHAGADNEKLARIFRLEQNEFGFLRTVKGTSGIYVCGCATGPMKIEEAYADSLAAAGEVSFGFGGEML